MIIILGYDTTNAGKIIAYEKSVFYLLYPSVAGV